MAIRRLRDCYASLDPAHQQDFARHAWHSAENDLPSHQRFWQDVVEQIL